MLVVEVIGGPARNRIAEQVRRVAARCSVAVRVVTAEASTHVAGFVVATETAGEAAHEHHLDADVVAGCSPGEIDDLWRSRLEEFARQLSGADTPSSPVRLVLSDPAWALLAKRKLRHLRRALASLADADTFDYAHIGSTSVPGLMAKPIIDLQICVPRLEPSEKVSQLLSPAGYLTATGARPDSPGVFADVQQGRQRVDRALLRKQLYVCPDPVAPMILHIRQQGSPFARHTVLLRDWLRDNPADRAAYQRLKIQLALEHISDADYDDYGVE